MMKYAFVAALLLATPALAQEVPPLVSVSGDAQVTRMPDQAVVNFRLERHTLKAQDAKKQVDDLQEKVEQVMKESRIDPKKLKTLGMQLNPRYRYEQRTGKQIMEGYTATQSLQLTVDDIDETGNVLQRLVDAGVDQIDHVQYQLKDQEQAMLEAMMIASQKARRRAAAIAKALGLTLGKPYRITSQGGGVSPPPPMPYMARAEAAAVGQMAMDKASPPQGEMTIHQSVQIDYRIE